MHVFNLADKSCSFFIPAKISIDKKNITLKPIENNDGNTIKKLTKNTQNKINTTFGNKKKKEKKKKKEYKMKLHNK